MNRDVFISYASTDKHMADAICSNLENSGIRCWIAPRDILPGSDWAQSILNAIKSSKVMVLVFSQNTSNSSQVTKELNLAISHNLMVVPFKIDDAVPSGSMEYYLADMHWLDTVDGDDQAQINRLKEVISSVLPLNIKPTPNPEVKPAPKVNPDPEVKPAPKAAPAAPQPSANENVGFFRAYGRFWKNTFNYKGCTSRNEYWKTFPMIIAGYFAFIILFAIVMASLNNTFLYYSHPGVYEFAGVLGFIGILAPVLPSVAIGIRRLHDVNRSGYWMWLSLTGIGSCVLLYFFLCKGVEENNRFK